MKRLIRSITAIILAIALIVLAVNTVSALSTGDAGELIDTSKSCSLTLTYAVDGKKIEGLEIELYQVAAVTEDFQYSMTGDFSEYPIKINGIKSQSEWNEVGNTVGAYIVADKISPAASKKTDDEGIVRFEELPVGIYYIRRTENKTAEQVQGFAPFMLSVPNLGDDGKWIYNVEAIPKPGITPTPKTKKITIIKLWDDNAQNEKRPSKIPVDIIKDGELFKTVELTAEKNWTYTCETTDDHTWTAAERDVPKGYTVSIQNCDGNIIQITNTLLSEPTPPPQTGDSVNIYPWVFLMAAAGIVLIFIGVFRRKNHEE